MIFVLFITSEQIIEIGQMEEIEKLKNAIERITALMSVLKDDNASEISDDVWIEPILYIENVFDDLGSDDSRYEFNRDVIEVGAMLKIILEISKTNISLRPATWYRMYEILKMCMTDVYDELYRDFGKYGISLS